MKRLLFAVALTVAASPALACRPLEDVLTEYQREFGETPMWMGESARSDGTLIALIAAPDGSWTMFKVDRYGACQIDYGQGSELLQRRGNV